MNRPSVDATWKRLIPHLVRSIMWLFITAAIVRMAWIGDDALITLRTILNWTHGWGPGFNPDENVAAYTHPLWFLLWTIIGSFMPSWVGANFLISITFSSAAVALLLWSTRTVPVVILSGLALLSSSAFIDYSSSGLENPLAYLLIALTYLQFRNLQSSPDNRLAFLYGLTVAGVALTRLDLILILAPVLIFQVWMRRTQLRGTVAMAAGFLAPTLLWQIWFSRTYSSHVPNTFEAKTNSDIPRWDLLVQGLRYLEISFTYDIGSLVVLLVTLIYVFVKGQAWQRAAAMGVTIYLTYVVWIGGDFMVGRFIAVPVFAMTLLSCLVARDAQKAREQPIWASSLYVGTSATLVASLIVLPVATPTSFLRNPEQKWVGQSGIVDERGVYAELGRSLHAWLIADEMPPEAPSFSTIRQANPWESLKLYDNAATHWPDRSDVKPSLGKRGVGVTCWLGGASLMTGPEVHWVDSCALADRFLASVTFQGDEWRIGHLKRPIPEGYLEAVATGNPDFVQDPELRERLVHLWNRIRR